jgi:hypothetical protein
MRLRESYVQHSTHVDQRPFGDIMSTSTGMAASKPLSRANATVISRKPPSRIRNQQPSVAELKSLGIKVKDFAYEKTLPPPRTVYLHRQILPGIAKQAITREKTEEDVLQLQQSHHEMRRLDWYVDRTHPIMLMTSNISLER